MGDVSSTPPAGPLLGRAVGLALALPLVCVVLISALVIGQELRDARSAAPAATPEPSAQAAAAPVAADPTQFIELPAAINVETISASPDGRYLIASSDNYSRRLLLRVEPTSIGFRKTTAQIADVTEIYLGTWLPDSSGFVGPRAVASRTAAGRAGKDEDVRRVRGRDRWVEGAARRGAERPAGERRRKVDRRDRRRRRAPRVRARRQRDKGARTLRRLAQPPGLGRGNAAGSHRVVAGERAAPRGTGREGDENAVHVGPACGRAGNVVARSSRRSRHGPPRQRRDAGSPHGSSDDAASRSAPDVGRSTRASLARTRRTPGHARRTHGCDTNADGEDEE